MTTQYTKDQKAYFDFRVKDSGGNNILPDLDTLKVEFYDSTNTLRLTATTDSTPPIQYSQDADGYFLFISDIPLDSFELGTVYAYTYATYNAEYIMPYPTVLVAFEVVAGEAVQVSKLIDLGTSVEILHKLTDEEGEILLGLTHDEVEAMYITGDGTLHPKPLNPDNFKEKGAGVYGITYSNDEVTCSGLFISIARPALYRTISIEILGVVIPTGTLTVTGKFYNLDGTPRPWEPIVVVNRDYSPTLGLPTVAQERLVYKSGIDGTFSFPLLPGALVEIITKRSSGIVRVPTDREVISLEELLAEAIDNYQPIDLTQ